MGTKATDEYKRLNYYRLAPDEVLEEVKSRRTGLKASEVRDRLEHLGPNMLHRAHQDSALTTFIRQFKNVLVVILLVSAALSLYLHDVKTATIMILIALMNTFV